MKETTYAKYYKSFYKGMTPSNSVIGSVRKGSVIKARSACDADDALPGDPSWLDWNIRRRGNHIYFYEEIIYPFHDDSSGCFNECIATKS